MKIFKSLLIASLCLVSSLGFAQSKSETKPKKSILMVLSSHGLEQGEKQPGYEFEEFAQAYLIFDMNNIAIEVASPKGGSVEADKYNPNKPYNKAILENPTAMEKLNNTLKTASIKASDYDAVFVVGGKGAMFDLAEDKPLQQIIASIYQEQGTVSAVCHGPAALADVKLANGEYLVSNKAVNGFTNLEEQLFGKKWLPHFKFKLEDRLIERGAKFESSGMMLSHVATDDRLITGQNPFSTIAVAEQVVVSLGQEPVARKPYKEEVTIALIKDILQDSPQAAAPFKKSPQDYQPELIAMYGFYQMKLAKNDAQIQKSVDLMELSRQYMPSIQLELAIVKGFEKLSQNERRDSRLQELKEKYPDNSQLDAYLAQLDK